MENNQKSHWKPNDVLVMMTIRDNPNRVEKINIYSSPEEDLDVIETTDFEDEKDNFYWESTAIDQNGLRCKVGLKLYKQPEDEEAAFLMIAYKDYSFCYKLKLNK